MPENYNNQYVKKFKNCLWKNTVRNKIYHPKIEFTLFSPNGTRVCKDSINDCSK